MDSTFLPVNETKKEKQHNKTTYARKYRYKKNKKIKKKRVHMLP